MRNDTLGALLHRPHDKNMTEKTQLIGISNAIVDILANVDETFLDEIGAAPGSMTLIDENQAEDIYSRMGPATEKSGGSVANTVAGFANLGGKAAYIGRVRNDQLGEIFVHDMRSLGVDIRRPPAESGAPTARSHILITPDGQRTMQTYLGACTELGVSDITPESMQENEVVLLEGYVWDIPEGPQLAARAIEIARETRARVALSLSDSLCVERHRKTFMDGVENGADIIFADEDEMMALVEAKSFEDVLRAIEDFDNLFVMTRSDKGSVIVHGDYVFQQDAIPVSKVVDTTGAGDAYTAAFLYGYTQGRGLDDCAKLGTWCATQVIQQLGARLEPDVLRDYPLSL